MRTACHEQQFDIASWFEYLFLGCHIGLSLVCKLDGKHLQGTHGNLLGLAGRDGNVCEGSPLKPLRTTKTTIIVVQQ